MGGQTAPARGSRWSRCAVLLGIAVVVWLLGTATQTAGAAPLASGTPIAAGRVAATSGLNMRAIPQTSAAVLRVLPFLTEVYILGAAVERDGYLWVPIRLKPEQGGQQGWIARRWLVALPLSVVHAPSSGSPGGTGLLADPQRLRVVKGSGDAQYAALNGVRYHIADLTTLQALNLGGYEQVSDAVVAPCVWDRYSASIPVRYSETMPAASGRSATIGSAIGSPTRRRSMRWALPGIVFSRHQTGPWGVWRRAVRWRPASRPHPPAPS